MHLEKESKKKTVVVHTNNTESFCTTLPNFVFQLLKNQGAKVSRPNVTAFAGTSS